MWDVVGPQLEAVMERGEATWAEDQPLEFDSRGVLETLYSTYSYSPIPDDQGGIGGVLLVTRDTTARVMAHQRLDLLRELTVSSMDAPSQREACVRAVRALRGVPECEYVVIYLLDETGGRATCAASTEKHRDLLEQSVELSGGSRLARLFRELAASPGEVRVVDGVPLVTREAEPLARRAIAVTLSRSIGRSCSARITTGKKP